jgi:ESCRT-II complex subunit VPS22
MCASINVDPLASSKGCWTDILGIGEYYFQLAVIITEIALKRRRHNGGVIAISDLAKILTGPSSPTVLRDVSDEDIRKAITKLSALGNGFRLVEVFKSLSQ